MRHSLLLLALVGFTFVSAACAREPDVQVAAGEMDDLYAKQELTSQMYDTSVAIRKLEKILAPARGDGLRLVKFTIGETLLTVWSKDGEEDKPVLQFPVKGHYDLERDQTKDGQKTQYLVKGKSKNLNWADRAYIEVDAADVKRIKPSEDIVKNLYEAKAIDGKSYRFLDERIPGIDDRVALELATKFNLQRGTLIQIRLSKTTLELVNMQQTKNPVSLLRLSVQYFDLVREKSDSDELTAKFKRDQSERTWDTRRYVEIRSELATLVDSTQKVLSKDGLGCNLMTDFPAQEILDDLKSKRISVGANEKICLIATQTVLSVCRTSCEEDGNLLMTYPIVRHLDIESLSGSQGSVKASSTNRNTWDQRAFIEFATNAPQVAEQKVQSTSLDRAFFTTGEFIYVATVVASHSENSEFFNGLLLTLDDRLKFSFTENKMIAYKARETLNNSSPTPVLRYSADHFTVGRAKNGLGDPTNVITELRDDPWAQRKQVRPALGRNEINSYFNHFLGINNLVSRDYLVSESVLIDDVKVLESEVTWTTEEVLVPNYSAGNLGAGETQLEPVSVRIRHSFVRLAPSDYQAQEYDDYDFQKFGYFRTTRAGLNASGNATDDTIKHFARRYDISNGKQIVFYLSAGFPESYKDEAAQVITSWNDAFKAATGRDNVVVLKDNEGQHYSDPLVNMIAYIDERNLGAPLGYGPTIADPETGEVLAGKTYLYGDAIRWSRDVSGDYHDLATGVKTIDDFAAESRQETVRAGTPPAATSAISPRQHATIARVSQEQLKSAIATTVFTGNGLDRLNRNLEVIAKGSLRGMFESNGDIQGMRQALQKDRNGLDRHALNSMDQNHGCLFRPEEHMVSASKFVAMNKDLSREELMAKVESATVYTTLLHELGHNFGLRHNFHGSYDEVNFHPEYFELKRKLRDPTATESPEGPDNHLELYKSSSIMDYTDMFEALHRRAGSYDVAAIKFGYAGLLEKIDLAASRQAGAIRTVDVPRKELDELVSLKVRAEPARTRDAAIRAAVAELGLRQYKFCTDDHVSDDPTCNRFDSGVNVSEIVESMILNYENNYTLGAFRRGRRNFTGGSSFVISRFMLPIRQMYDEFIYRILTGTFAQSGAESRGDFQNAVLTGLDFFKEILTTPEPGVYQFDKELGIYVESPASSNLEENLEHPPLVVGLGLGKYLQSSFVQTGSSEKVMRRGVLVDKIGAMIALSLRGYPAERYERASMTFNYFDIFRDDTLNIFSNAMRETLKGNYSALKLENGALLALPSDVAQTLPPDLLVQNIEVKAPTHTALKMMSMALAVEAHDGTADRTFGDYLDMRIDGIDAQSIPEGTPTLRFRSANGTRTYVIPQTRDGRSITFLIAKDAPGLAEKLAQAIAISADPQRKQRQSELANQLFSGFLQDFSTIYKELTGVALGQEQAAELESDKTEGMQNMIRILEDWLGQIEQNLAANPNGAAAARLQKAKEMIEKSIATPGELLLEFSQLGAEMDEAENDAQSTQRELVRIESDLLQLRQLYKEVFRG